ncbi:DUF397 domain-containing protein [Actinokineospora sp. HBU206404]|uniref:DUF397 domain-containing protein n=2 Tax=Actinokineospora xionganensis TaxID=2684470 RepID=A0ABR7L468_9PSEU|nr:DUF397 domain-containing protein [Actinokineospora xionganensis]
MTRGRWRKSTFSGGGDSTDCVEVSLTLDRAGIRDSKNATGPTVTVTAQTWSVFVTHISQT